MLRLLVSTVPCWVPSSSLLLLRAPALPSVALLLYLYGWVECSIRLLLHLVHHLLLVDALIHQLLLQVVVCHDQLLVGGCEPVDGGSCRIVRGCKFVYGFVE